MRDIKFRAWDGVNNIWLDFYEYMIYLEIGEIRGVSCCEMVSPRRDVVIEQYTGIEDISGKQIYEHDILKDLDDGTIIGLVAYDEQFCQYECGGNSLYDCYNCAVIGNIHENADLLEEQS